MVKAEQVGRTASSDNAVVIATFSSCFCYRTVGAMDSDICPGCFFRIFRPWASYHINVKKLANDADLGFVLASFPRLSSEARGQCSGEKCPTSAS